MRIITGSARGVPLATLPGEEVLRPTSQRLKEAMFSVVQFELAGARVLDAFAGSGQLGLEALSRGAAHCVFVDANRGALQVLQKNLERCKLSERSTVVPGNALLYLQRATPSAFDLVLLDPPYASGLLHQAIPLALAALSERGVLLCEAHVHEPLPDECGAWRRQREYKHGHSKFAVYRKGGSA